MTSQNLGCYNYTHEWRSFLTENTKSLPFLLIDFSGCVVWVVCCKWVLIGDGFGICLLGIIKRLMNKSGMGSLRLLGLALVVLNYVGEWWNVVCRLIVANNGGKQIWSCNLCFVCMHEVEDENVNVGVDSDVWWWRMLMSVFCIYVGLSKNTKWVCSLLCEKWGIDNGNE